MSYEMDFQNFGTSKLNVNYTMRRLPNIVAVLRDFGTFYRIPAKELVEPAWMELVVEARIE